MPGGVMKGSRAVEAWHSFWICVWPYRRMCVCYTGPPQCAVLCRCPLRWRVRGCYRSACVGSDRRRNPLSTETRMTSRTMHLLLEYTHTHTHKYKYSSWHVIHRPRSDIPDLSQTCSEKKKRPLGSLYSVLFVCTCRIGGGAVAPTECIGQVFYHKARCTLANLNYTSTCWSPAGWPSAGLQPHQRE